MPARSRLLAQLHAAHALTNTIGDADDDSFASSDHSGNGESTNQLICTRRNLTTLPQVAPQVHTVDVSHNAIAELDIFDANGPVRAACEALTCLTANWNRLQEITEGHLMLNQLRELHCAFNQLNSLPECVSRQPALRALVCNDNTITSLPSSLGVLGKTLQHLNVQYNALTALPPGFGKLTRLASLSAAGNTRMSFPPPDVLLEGAKGVLQWFQREESKKGGAGGANHTPMATRSASTTTTAQATATVLAHATAHSPEQMAEMEAYTARLLVEAGFFERGGSLDPDKETALESLTSSPTRAALPPLPATSDSAGASPTRPDNGNRRPPTPREIGEPMPRRIAMPPAPVSPARDTSHATMQAPFVGSFATAASRAARRSSASTSYTAHESARGSGGGRGGGSIRGATSSTSDIHGGASMSAAISANAAPLAPAIGEDDAFDIVASVLARCGRGGLSASVEAALTDDVDDDDDDDEEEEDDDDDDEKVAIDVVRDKGDGEASVSANIGWPANTEPHKSFICPITLAVMLDPCVCADGQSYERRAIERWLVRHDTSPLTGEKLASKELRPNFALKSLISEFREEAEKQSVHAS
ncbi:U-box domain-containing protein [Pseudoscourfieldia marina]